jgi:hypothetical protein
VNRQIRLRIEGAEISHSMDLAALKQMLDEKFGAGSSGNECSVMELFNVVCGTSPPLTFFEVCGEDGFYARIPWRLAGSSMFLFPDLADGGSADSGLRLVVRGSSNECLNVKRVVDILFGTGDEPAQPVFGCKLPGVRQESSG